MPASNPAAWDAFVSAMEEDLIATPDSELLAEASGGEIATLRTLIASRVAGRSALASPTAPRRRVGSRLPRDSSERRAMLRLLLTQPASHRLAVGFSGARELPDQEVEKLLLLLLSVDEPDGNS